MVFYSCFKKIQSCPYKMHPKKYLLPLLCWPNSMLPDIWQSSTWLVTTRMILGFKYDQRGLPRCKLTQLCSPVVCCLNKTLNYSDTTLGQTFVFRLSILSHNMDRAFCSHTNYTPQIKGFETGWIERWDDYEQLP